MGPSVNACDRRVREPYRGGVRADIGEDWVHDVVAVCDPVFAAADVGFVHQVSYAEPDIVAGLLWEADPPLFVAKYPDSGVVDSYGLVAEDIPCLDYWVYVDAEKRVM